MNIKDVAAMFSGRKYGDEIKKDEELLLKKEGVVVLFGYSDDNMEFRGAIDDEVGCYSGGKAYITRGGKLLSNECSNEDCPHFEKIKQDAAIINAIWGQDGYSWTYKTNIPHETFNILEGDELYCRGIVFNINNI